ncbi:MAG TPA: hypothetical protein VIS06_15910 [Mycobacteriales bacterium]
MGLRAGRYPLAVEGPVMAAVDALVPGVSTVSRYARYYGLYWALARYAAERGLEMDACRRLVRRAEVCLAAVSLRLDDTEKWPGMGHGVDQVRKLGLGGADPLSAARDGAGSYSPRVWGFWSQYAGPCAVLGTVTVGSSGLRPGPHPCPDGVAEMFAPLLDMAARKRPDLADVTGVAELAMQYPGQTPDSTALAELLTATRGGRHDPEEWLGNDNTRRASLRTLARAWQLHPDAETWMGAFRAAVAYGPTANEDPLLARERRTQAWRGLLLRHLSVGAWRWLWALLVDQVLDAGRTSRAELHEWIVRLLPDQSLASFEASLPDLVDGRGDPLPAEEQASHLGDVVAQVAVLLLGARRPADLSDLARSTFLGRRADNAAHFLDPVWVDHLRMEFSGRSVRELGRRLVDDMLAQSHRVALRKLRHNQDGTMTLFSRLHERNGWYFASSSEGRHNIGLRIPQLGDLARQVGLFSVEEPVTATGRTLLDLP